MFISPSFLATRSFGIEPTGFLSASTLDTQLRCRACGAPTKEADEISPSSLKETFTDFSSLAQPESTILCAACDTVLSKPGVFLQLKSGVSVFNDSAIYQLEEKGLTQSHLSWLWQSPPPVPFCVVVKTGKQQHLTWRAPVTVSPDKIFVRMGETLGVIRRKILFAARNEALALKPFNPDRTKGKPKKEKFGAPLAETPFFCGDTRKPLAKTVALKFWVMKAINEGGITQDMITNLLQLNPFEVWALGHSLHPPAQPKATAI